MAVAAIELRAQGARERRTRVFRGAIGEGAAWELWQRTPSRALTGRVIGLWAGLSPLPLARHRVLPNGELSLMFHVGPGQRLAERDGVTWDETLRSGFLSGLQERPITVESPHADTRVVSVRLAPLGAFALLDGLPQHELRADVIELDAVLGGVHRVGALRERLLEARDLGAALDLVEAWLEERFARGREPHPVTRALCDRIAATGGRLRVERAAREAGLSPRRLHELFQREVGVPPKRLARIVRFRRTLDALAVARNADLADLALRSGYADQAHLHRDFRALAGLTPRTYLEALGDGADGADVVAG